jgi:hypothetical protein
MLLFFPKLRRIALHATELYFVRVWSILAFPWQATLLQQSIQTIVLSCIAVVVLLCTD